MSTASKVAAGKAARPDLYCPTDRCLWRTGGGHCPRHGGTAVVLSADERAVLARVRAYVTPCPLLLTSRGADAERLVEKGLMVLRWVSSDRAFGYYGLTVLGDEVAAVVTAA